MGPILLVMATAWVISLFAFRNSTPHRRALYTAGTAWLLCAAGFGLFLPSGFVGGLLGFSIGAAIVGVERYIHYAKHWTDEPEASSLTDTFN